MKEKKHDLVVIGAGPGGYVAAIRAAQLGLNVACVEKEQALGGTCLRIGCIPSKALLESSSLFWKAQHEFGKHGIRISNAQLDLAAMQRRKEQVVGTLTKGVDLLFKKNKVARYFGQGRIEGAGRVTVISEKETFELNTKSILIATGSKPSTLPGVALDGNLIGTSTEALSYSEVPKHLVVIGAGYIGVELGSVWRRLGAKVTVLEYLNRILFGLDAEVAAAAKKVFEQQGLEFRLGAKVLEAKVENGECVVRCEGIEPILCDRVLMAVGRVPNTEHLGLENLPLELHKKGFIPVTPDFATSIDGIYAIGDVIPGPMLAHKAEEEGIACVERLVTGHGHVNYDAIPAVVYTEPEIGAVGKNEEELHEAGIEFRKGVFPFRANARARTLGEVEGMVKILADAKTDRVLGVHVFGAHAGDLINEAAAAIAFGASAEDLARTCHAHPTLGEALREAGLGVGGRAINI
ncbi:MAG TPA: dihydrolipoyl dehydrogenase [Candidatus Dormibacteraeota bacterium]|nr:dihydrolipoyl dehydrogenase [Candidatus Dormibacteraeota bacterium]